MLSLHNYTGFLFIVPSVLSFFNVFIFLSLFLFILLMQELLLNSHIAKPFLPYSFLLFLLLKEGDIVISGAKPGHAHVVRISGRVQRCSRKFDQSARAVIQTLHCLLMPAVVVDAVPPCVGQKTAHCSDTA